MVASEAEPCGRAEPAPQVGEPGPLSVVLSFLSRAPSCPCLAASCEVHWLRITAHRSGP